MPRSIDALRPNVRLQIAARSAATAAQLAAIAEDADRRVAGRPGRMGGPQPIGEALVHLFSQRPLPDPEPRTVSAPVAAPPAEPFRREALESLALELTGLSLVVS